jgi:hypothetical protein
MNEVPSGVLIVFGYGPVRSSPVHPSGRLNLYGKINALAAGMLYECRAVQLIEDGA